MERKVALETGMPSELGSGHPLQQGEPGGQLVTDRSSPGLNMDGETTLPPASDRPGAAPFQSSTLIGKCPRRPLRQRYPATTQFGWVRAGQAPGGTPPIDSQMLVEPIVR